MRLYLEPSSSTSIHQESSGKLEIEYDEGAVISDENSEQKDSEIGDLESRIGDLEDRIKDLEAEGEEFEAIIAKLETDLGESSEKM